MLQIGSKKTHQPAKMEELVFLEIKISPVFVLQGLQVIYYTPTHRVGAILQSPCPYVRPSVRSHFRNRYLSFYWKKWFYIWWLWHGDLYRVSPFQVYCTSTSCLQCDLEFFMFPVMKTFVTVISASTGRNDFIFDIWLWHGDLYHVSPFQVYRISTSCLPCDVQMNEWGYS